MADDGQTAEALDDRDMGDTAEAPIAGWQDIKDAEHAKLGETPNFVSEEDDANAVRTQTQIELDNVQKVENHLDTLIYSPSNLRKKQLDADIAKLGAEIEELQQRAEKIIENKNLREKAEVATQKRGVAALGTLMDSIAQNVEEDKQESARGAAYTALLNIARDIKRTLKKDYTPDNQPFELAKDDSYPVKDILPALALHLYEDGNIQKADDLTVLGTAEEIGSTTAGVVASYESAVTEEQNKKHKRLKKLRSDIAKKNNEIVHKNGEKQELSQEVIHQEKQRFLDRKANLKKSLYALLQYKKSLNTALEAPSAEAYFAGNEDMLAIFKHMDSELGDNADAIALKHNDDRKRYFITLKNLDEEKFDDLVREAQQDIASLANLRAKEEIEENPHWTEKHYDVTDLIDQDRDVVSQDYIPTFESLDKLAKSADLNTVPPKQTTKTTDADKTDGNADAQEKMTPINYTSFAQYRQRAEHAIAELENSLKSKERLAYDAYMARIEERGTEDATEEQLETTEVAGQDLLKSATEADAKLAKLRPKNTPMLNRAKTIEYALTLADETDADEHFKNPENSTIIDLLNKKIENAESEEQKGEYETLKKMMVAASSVDTSQAEEGSPVSIMQNLRDDIEDLRAKAEESSEEDDITDEKIIDAVRSHMDAMAENYLPSEKQLKNAQKTSYFRALNSRIKSLVQRVTGTRNKVKKELTGPTISDEEMNAAIDKLVAPESDDEKGLKNDDKAEKPADDHDDLPFADETDDRLEPQSEELHSTSDGLEIPNKETISEQAKAVDALKKSMDEVEKTGDSDDDELEVEEAQTKDKLSMLASFDDASTGAVVAVATMVAMTGLGQEIGTYAFGAAGGALAGFALFNGLKNDPKRTLFTLGATIGAAAIVKVACAGLLATNPGIVAMMGVGALAGAIAGVTGALVSNGIDKLRGKEDVKLTDGLLKSAFRGAAFGAFAGVLGFAFAGDGADNALAAGQNADISGNGAENAGLSGDAADTETEFGPTPGNSGFNGLDNYEIQKNDTLSKLVMENYGVRGEEMMKFVELIAQHNKIDNIHLILEGGNLDLPPQSDLAAAAQDHSVTPSLWHESRYPSNMGGSARVPSI